MGRWSVDLKVRDSESGDSATTVGKEKQRAAGEAKMEVDDESEKTQNGSSEGVGFEHIPLVN